MDNLQIMQELTLDELGYIMGFDAGNLNEKYIREGSQTNVDNYDGNMGFNVYFDLVEAHEEDSVHEFTVKITDIYEL